MIHRKAVPLGVPFQAPERVTFGYQEQRQEFSVWYAAADSSQSQYVVLGTGHVAPEPVQIVDTVIMPDGFHAFHLCRLGSEVKL